MKTVSIEFTNNELWKILDAIKSYTKDYAVSVAVHKTFSIIESKITKSLKE